MVHFLTSKRFVNGAFPFSFNHDLSTLKLMVVFNCNQWSIQLKKYFNLDTCKQIQEVIIKENNSNLNKSYFHTPLYFDNC